MAEDVLVHSKSLVAGQSGLLLELPRERAGWEWMSFYVRLLAAGDHWQTSSAREEQAIVLLGGRCTVDIGSGRQRIGERDNALQGLPYAVYLPAGGEAAFQAETTCEFAQCCVPSQAKLAARVVTPDDVSVSLRGGGNASRQIVDVMPPGFPGDRVMAVEVYTPSGNWSSYPPHKHEVHQPPDEVDLDEIYYYRIFRPGGYAHQRLYSSNGERDMVVTARDGDAVLVRDGYHPVVAGHGYDVYYLNFLAGSARSLANTIDPAHAWVMSSWSGFSPGVPIVPMGRALKA
jgi:5-deoxy-glucuronate isomerase